MITEYIRRIRDDVTYRWKLCTTFAVFFSYVMQGWSDQQIGMTLLDLQRLIGVDQETITSIMIVWNIGCVVGSLVTGALFDTYDRLLLMFGFTLTLGAGTVVLPYCTTLAWMLVCRFFLGVFLSSSDTGANTIIPTVWGDKCGPFVQLLYVCYAIGGVISPYATLPFMSKNSESEFSNNSTSIVSSNTANIRMSFMITGLLYVVCALPYIVLKFYSQCRVFSRSVDNYESLNDENQKENKEAKDKRLTVVLICLMCGIHAVFIAVEENLMVFLVPFTVEYLKWGNANSATIMSLYWITSCIVGSLGIVIAAKVDPSAVLWLSLIITNFSFVFVIAGIYFSQTWLIWFGIISSGCGMIMVTPTVFTWSQYYACDITGKVSSFFVVIAGLFVAASCYFTGFMMEHYSKVSFIFILLGGTVICLFLFAGAYFLRFKFYDTKTQSFKLRVINKTTD